MSPSRQHCGVNAKSIARDSYSTLGANTSDGHDGTGDENETGDEHEGGAGGAGLGSSHSHNELGGGGSLGSGTLNKNNPKNSNDKITHNTASNNNDGKTSLKDVGSNEQLGRQTAVLVESDGFVTKNGPRVVIHSRSPSITSRSAADV
jgi:hypothetical protein